MSDLLLCTREGIDQVQEALRKQELDGWLLYEFRGANPISKSMLGVAKTTRRGFFLIPREGDPVALIHAIEGSSWRHWPWEKRMYSGWREMESSLETLLGGLGRVAMEISPGAAVPTLDYVPAGLTEVLLRSGIEATSSGNLISRFHSVWTAQQLEDHKEAAEILPKVAMQAFQMAAQRPLTGVGFGHFADHQMELQRDPATISAGALEAVATVLCLRHEKVHPTTGFGETDSATPVNLVEGRAVSISPMRAGLSLNLGFGGSNAALLLAKREGSGR